MSNPTQIPPDLQPKEMTSGLFCEGRPIPLESVHITGQINGLCSQITIKQRYQNTEDQEIEAIYLFPLEEQAAVCGFVARLKDRVIRGEIDEKERAFERYDEALREGNSAFLMEQVRPDIFTVSVGRIPAQESVEIEISYVAELSYEGPAIRLMLPTTVSPRYIPSHQAQEEPHLAQTLDAPRQTSVPYGLHLELQLRLSSGLRHVESPTHPIRVTLEDDHAVVSLSQRETAMDRDLVLQIEPRKPHEPFAQVACTPDGARFAMLHFRPDPEGAPILPSEVFFVLDCSGSMSGSSIEEAKRALALCVRSLSEGDTFQIIRFGSSFERLWPTSVPFNQEHLDEASTYIQSVDADLGGTELYEPMQSIYQQPLDPSRQRQIIVLTDGQVSNEAEVIRLCRKGRPARVFSFGIGEGVSQHLVRGLARASNGSAEFISSGERIEPKVLRTFGRLNTPIFDKIEILWGNTKATLAPKQLPPLFAGEGMTVFAQLQQGHDPQVTLQADKQSWALDLDFEKAERDSPIPTLWARHAIRDLEESDNEGSQQQRPHQEEKKREKILQLSKTFGLMSSVASYVAVEERPNDERSDEPVALRRVPIALTTGWGGHPLLNRPAPMAVGGFANMAFGGLAGSAIPAMSAPMRSTLVGLPSSPSRGGAGGFGRTKGAASSTMDWMEMDESDGVVASIAAPAEGAPPEKELLLESTPTDALRSAAPKEENKLRMPTLKKERKEQAQKATFKTNIEDRVMDLLLTQRADGSFPESAILQTWLGARWAALQERAQQASSSFTVYTLAALFLLRKEAAAQSSLWGRAEQKAQRWLDQQSDLPDLNDIL